MNWRSTIGAAAMGGLLGIGLILSTTTADGGSSPTVTVTPSVRPFDPRTDRLATDSAPQLNLAGRPGVELPNLCEQRAKGGGPGGQPWTVSCRPARTPQRDGLRSAALVDAAIA
jgi:hypothetical protein